MSRIIVGVLLFLHAGCGWHHDSVRTGPHGNELTGPFHQGVLDDPKRGGWNSGAGGFDTWNHRP